MTTDRNIIELHDLCKSFADLEVLSDINLDVKNGEFLTLLGPSGCGKTTLLRLISGFETPTSGSIHINGQNSANVPPHLRHVNTVFQSYALFPHMTVFDNIAFGLRCKKLPKTEIQQRVEEALAVVKLAAFADRLPAELSGGQQQRVAVARAAVNQPLVLLLDEPLSSLDYRLRKTLQIELKQLQRKLGITFIFVTHDQEEALSMSDRIVVMNEGVIQQIGTPREVYESPHNLTVARFVGEVNIFPAQVITVNGERLTVDIAGQQREIKQGKHQLYLPGQMINVLVRPEDIRVLDHSEVDDPRQMLAGTVEEVIYKGTTVDLIVRLNNQKTIAATMFFDEDDDTLIYTLGEAVWANWAFGWEVILPYES